MAGFFGRFLECLLGRKSSRLAFDVASVTDRGLVREENQDAFVCEPEIGFLCVADGMGGGDGGALASAWTCAALAESWKATGGRSFAERGTALGEALQEVNGRIRAYAKEKSYKMMGTTVAALLRDEAAAKNVPARIFHVGDSRIYRLRQGTLELLTRDHTVGNELGSAMSAKSADQAASLRARSNPLTHILTRAVGTEMRARPEWKTESIQRSDRFLLCSDGVHDMLDDPEIAAILKGAASPRAAVARLEAEVRRAGAGDNYTIVCADVVARA